MSKTPRTDEHLRMKEENGHVAIVSRDFARQLETELADKDRQLAEARADCPNERLVILQDSLQALRNMTQVQCTDGNWNFDPYMHGMANGMIFALSLFEAGEPKYLDAPAEWLKDRPTPEVVSGASAT